MRVLRLKRITERFEHIALFWNAGTLRVMRCFITAMVVWHLVACMYFVTAHGVGFCKWADANANTTAYDKYSLWDQDGSGTQPNGFQDCYDDWTPWNQIVNQPFATQYAQAFFWAVFGFDQPRGARARRRHRRSFFVLAAPLYIWTIFSVNF